LLSDEAKIHKAGFCNVRHGCVIYSANKPMDTNERKFCVLNLIELKWVDGFQRSCGLYMHIF